MSSNLRTAGLITVLAAFSALSANAQDLASLFKDETAGVGESVQKKPGELSDETRLALAATGATWKPESGGQAIVTPDTRDHRRIRYAPLPDRVRGFRSAHRSGNERAAVPFALSIVLSPENDSAAWQEAFAHLSRYGDDFDRVILGTLTAPDDVPLLPSLRYAAADLLVIRANPRHLALLLTLAESSDRYLRSRAVAALGVVGYRRSGAQTVGWVAGSEPGCRLERSTGGPGLREFGISALQQQMIAAEVTDAAKDKNYRTRAAAAFALGLTATDQDIPLLENLAKDRAYVVYPELRYGARVVFPVREMAAAALARLGRTVFTGSGSYIGNEFKRVTRGGKDVSRDSSDIKKELTSGIRFTRSPW